jgi:alpha-beta hydrolase superfamily lysophospholipase
VLLLLAENDRIIQNRPTRKFVDRFAAADKHVIEYEAAHHTLEFEPHPDRFIDDWIEWMHARLPTMIRARQQALLAVQSAGSLNPGTC